MATDAGAITLTYITANTIFARNFTGDIILDSGALTANAASGDSIFLASGRNFIDNAGACGALGAGNGFLYSFNPNAAPTVTSPALPDTMLYVSQTPADALVQALVMGTNANGAVGSQPIARGENKQSYLVSSSDQNGKVSYSLFNGWITIAPELVQLLGLDKAQI